ncbi:transcription factor IIIA-like [Ptychodera flava]|uniref:transcription factor IIIA-like n=1 Tax=Ptychodera flava TaxID=63121 RepID=UPI00396A7536
MYFVAHGITTTTVQHTWLSLVSRLSPDVTGSGPLVTDMLHICPYEGCEAFFNKPWRLEIHIYKHTGERPFVCTHEGCNKDYRSKEHLKRHIQTHSGEKPFSCPREGCKKTFVCQSNVNKHLKRYHKDDRYMCEFEGCGKVFRKHQHLKTHQYEHTNVKPYKCEHEGCNAAFTIPSKLKRHSKIHQGYRCTQEGCTAVFDKWSELRRHMSNHVQEHPCEVCDKSFKNRHKLKLHLLTHSKEREIFHCTYAGCEKTYLKAQSLTLHVENYHEGKRPYACAHEGCTKTFKHKVSLVQHQVVHDPNRIPKEKKPRKKVSKLSLASKLSGYKVKNIVTNQTRSDNVAATIAEDRDEETQMEETTSQTMPSEAVNVTQQCEITSRMSSEKDLESEGIKSSESYANGAEATEVISGSKVILSSDCTCQTSLPDIGTHCKLHMIAGKA